MYTIDVDEEERAYQQRVADVQAEWARPERAHLRRPYTAQAIAALRNTVPRTFASSAQGRKLWAQLRAHAAAGTCELTFGTTEPTVMSQMAKHQQTVYVSGALCGLSEVQHPGMDHADYPWDTVPKVVSKLFQAQLWHDQRQAQARLRVPKAQRAALEGYDFLMPIVADADMGFGGLTTTAKLAQAFVEAGVAMVHLDDLAIGLKKFTVGEGRTVVPTSEYLARLTAVRMQFDVLGVDTLLLCRCDVDRSQFITSCIDPRDHAYILGATVDIEPLVDAVQEGLAAGRPYVEVRDAWKARAGLMTFDEAVRAAAATDEQYAAYVAAGGTAPATALRHKRAAATAALGRPVTFDWELPRSREGQYMWRPTLQAVVDRAVAAAPLGDVTWARMDAPVWADLVAFHEGVRAVFPDRLFAFGFTGMYDYAKAGFSAAQVASLHTDLARLGVVWQVQPTWAVGGLNIPVEQFAREWRRDGIAGYGRTISVPSRVPPVVDGFHKPTYAGMYLADAIFATVNGEPITPREEEK